MTLLGAFAARRMGSFAHPVIVAPLWWKRMDSERLRSDFARLRALDFTHFIGGHVRL